MKQLLATLLITSALVGCSSAPTPPQPQPLAPVTYQLGELNRDTINDILVAEIAGQREDFDLALATYMRQAHLTKDAEIAKRATQIAQFLNREDDTLEAVQIWREAAPDEAKPYQIEASIRLFKQQYDQALPLIRKAYNDNPKTTLQLIQAQISAMPPSVLTGFSELLSNLTKETPPNAELWLTVSMLEAKQDRPAAALDAIEKSVALDNKHLTARLQQADLLRFFERHEESLAVINTALQHHIDNKRLLLLKTQILFNTGKTSEAINQIETLKDLHPKDTVLLHFLALISLEHAVFNESEQLFTMLEPLEENPNRSRFYLGVIAQQQELFDKAVSRFDLVDPKSTYYIASLARISSILDSPEDQEDIDQRFTKALTLRPDLEPDLFAIHAEWQKKHGFTDESLALLDFALAKHPDDIDLRYTRALQLESINFDGTVRDLKHIIALENNNATALNALGYTMLLHTNRYQEAFDYISRALKASPDDVSIIDSMGWAHHKLGNYDKALEYLERAYSISQDEEIASHLIQSLWSTGQTERAQQLLKESLQKSPDNKHLIEAAKQLETS